MRGVRELLSCFQRGRLVRPSAGVLNFVDLVRAVLHLAGAEGIELGRGAGELAAGIGPAEHYVLILIDGMGMDLLARLPAEGFLRSHLTGQLQSVFPSTTATALTALATAQWPCAHGVPGWWTYLERFHVSATTLPFVERFTGRPLDRFGVRAEDLYPVPSLWSGLKHAPVSVVPARIADSVFNRYASGRTPQAGYAAISEAIAAIRDRLMQAAQPTLTYLYLPQIDSLCHKKGTAHQAVADLLASLERQLAELAGGLAGRARVVVTADHGFLDTPEDSRFILTEDDELVSELVCPPTGDPTVPIFHVRPGREEAFVQGFAGRFGEAFALIAPEEAETLRLFGPEPPSPVLRRRLGSFVGIAVQPAAICYQPAGEQAHVHAAVHAGLSRNEMLIPLILA